MCHNSLQRKKIHFQTMIRALKFQIDSREARNRLNKWAKSFVMSNNAWKSCIQDEKHVLIPTFLPFYHFKFSTKLKYNGTYSANKTTHTVRDAVIEERFVTNGTVYASNVFARNRIEELMSPLISGGTYKELTSNSYKNLNIPIRGTSEYEELKRTDPRNILCIDWNKQKIDSNSLYVVDNVELTKDEAFKELLHTKEVKEKINEYCLEHMEKHNRTIFGFKYSNYKIKKYEEIDARYTFTDLVYVPVYVLYMEYRGKPYRLYVSGLEHGDVTGYQDMSLFKAFGASLLACGTVGEGINLFSSPEDYEAFYWLINMNQDVFAMLLIPTTVVTGFILKWSSQKKDNEDLVPASPSRRIIFTKQDEEELRKRLKSISYSSDIKRPVVNTVENIVIKDDVIPKFEQPKPVEPKPQKKQTMTAKKITLKNIVIKDDVGPQSEPSYSTYSTEETRYSDTPASYSSTSTETTTSSVYELPTIDWKVEEWKQPSDDALFSTSSTSSFSTTSSDLSEEINAGTDYYSILKLDPKQRDSYKHSEIIDHYLKLKNSIVSDQEKKQMEEAYTILSDSSKRYFYEQYGKQYVRELYGIRD
jgi:hypothetical protein